MFLPDLSRHSQKNLLNVSEIFPFVIELPIDLNSEAVYDCFYNLPGLL